MDALVRFRMETVCPIRDGPTEETASLKYFRFAFQFSSTLMMSKCHLNSLLVLLSSCFIGRHFDVPKRENTWRTHNVIALKVFSLFLRALRNCSNCLSVFTYSLIPLFLNHCSYKQSHDIISIVQNQELQYLQGHVLHRESLQALFYIMAYMAAMLMFGSLFGRTPRLVIF